MLYVITICKPLFVFIFLKIYQNMGQKLGSNKGYGQNEEESPRRRSHSPTQERSHYATVPVRSEHSCRVQTSHRRREKHRHSHHSMLNSSSSSGPYQERPRRRVEENSRHHQPAR
jgi:hypothetical protein